MDILTTFVKIQEQLRLDAQALTTPGEETQEQQPQAETTEEKKKKKKRKLEEAEIVFSIFYYLFN